MKRFPFLAILGFSIFIVGPSAFAQLPPVDIKASGFIDMVTFWYSNIAPGTPGQGIYSFTTPPLRPDASPSRFLRHGIARRLILSLGPGSRSKQ